MFDINSTVLKLKHEMQRPADFFKVTAFTFVVFGVLCFGFNILSTIAFGNNIQSPITDNFMSLSNYKVVDVFGRMDQQLFFASKILVVVMLTANFMLYQDSMFENVDSIYQMVVPVEGENEKTQKSLVFYSTRTIMLILVLIISFKIPQNLEYILTIMGALVGTTLTILFPILIFNKAYRNTGKFSFVIAFNWVIFALSIVIGSLGLYQGIKQLNSQEVLTVVN